MNLQDDQSLGDAVESINDNSLLTEFAVAILELASVALNSEGMTYEDFGIESKFVNSLLLRDAHALNSREDLEIGLGNSEQIAVEAGFDSTDDVPSANYFGDKSREIEEHVYTEGSKRKTHREIINNGAMRAVWAVVRHGAVLPRKTIEDYEIPVDPVIDEEEISMETKRFVIRNWVEFLLEKTVFHFDFGRASNNSYPLKTFIGVLAHCALQPVSVESAHRTLPSSCNREGPSDINEEIRSLSMDEIKQQFREIHTRFIEITEELGFWEKKRDVAFDPTSETAYTDDTEKTIGYPSKSGQVWFYPMTGTLDREARFGLSGHLVTKKSFSASRLQDDLESLSDMVDRLFIDAEYHDSNAIRACQWELDGNWVIKGDEKKLSADDIPTEDELPDPGEGPLWRTADIKSTTVNAVWYNFQDSRKVFLTGLSEKEVDNDWEIYNSYQNRDSIEPMFGDIKDDFIPFTNSSSPSVRLFYLNIALLFYNFYILINRTRAPKFMLRLDPIPQQIPTEVRHVCLECGCDN